MSAIDHTAYFASRLLWPSGRTRIRSQRPCAPSVPAMRTSSCCRLPSRAALSRRNTASETSGLPMKTRSTGRTSCARRGARQRQIGGVGIDHMAAGIGDREPVIGVIGDAAHDRIVGGAVGEADDAGGKGEQVEQPDHRQQRQQRRGYRAAPAPGRCVISATAAATMPPATSSTSTMLPPRRAGSCARHGSGGGSLSGSAVMTKGRGLSSMASMRRAVRAPAPECLNRTRKRKSIRRLFRRVAGHFRQHFRSQPALHHARRPESPRFRPMT